MSNKSISVVILNWNGINFLKDFLPGVVRNSPEADVVVADNASEDESVEWVKSNHPEVKLILFEKNFGFCKGYNEALKLLNSKYFVLLNSDVEVSPNWLIPLHETLEKNPEVAAVQPKIKWQRDKKFFEYAGAAGGFIDKFGYPFCRGRILQEVEKDIGQYDISSEIFWGSGACLMVRSKLYKDLGGLDENFFAHMEEIDFCWRLQNSGNKIFYVPESTVYHIGGGTLPKTNPWKTYLNHRNSLFLLFKNLPEDIKSTVIFKRLILDGLSGIIYLLQFKIGEFKALLKAHKDFRKMKKHLLIPDQKIDPKSFRGFYKKSILFDYFLRKKRKFSDLGIF